MNQFIICLVVVFCAWLGQLEIWQRKEYRLDRMKSHIIDHLDGNYAILLWWLFVVVLTITSFLVPSFTLYFIIVLGVLEILKSTASIARTGINRPTPTLRLSLIALLSLVFFYLLTFYLENSGILLAWALLPIIVSLSVMLSSPLASYGRHRAYKKAGRLRSRKNHIPIVGITGSYGKTTTKEWMYQIMRSKYITKKTPKNQNTEIAIARNLNKLLKNSQLAVVEVGAYKRGEIKTVCNFLRPDIGIITAIDDQHLHLFGSKENLLRAKLELIESLPENGLAILNHQLIHEAKRYEKLLDNIKAQVLTFGVEEGDCQATNIRNTASGVIFDFVSEQKTIKDIRTNLINELWLTNLLPCIIVACHLKVSEENIRKKIATLSAKGGLLEPLPGTNGSVILDDSYNCTPAGFHAALTILKNFPTSGRRFIVTRNMLELGARSKDHHYVIGKRMGEIASHIWLTKKAGAKYYQRGISETPRKKASIATNPYKLINTLRDILAPGDVILIENRVPNVIIKNLIEASAKEIPPYKSGPQLQQEAGQKSPGTPLKPMES